MFHPSSVVVLFSVWSCLVEFRTSAAFDASVMCISASSVFEELCHVATLNSAWEPTQRIARRYAQSSLRGVSEQAYTLAALVYVSTLCSADV